MNYESLNQYIYQFAISKIAEHLDITVDELTDKLNDRDEFYATEIIELVKLLNITNPTAVFFCGENKQETPNSEPDALQEARSALNDVLSTITALSVQIEKPKIFLHDTLSDFFDHYEKLKHRDTDELFCMWYSAKNYKVYVESALEYIWKVSESINTLNNELEATYDHLFKSVDND